MTGAWKRRRARTAEAEPTRAELPKRELVEPTPDERRNGWDAASLAAYRVQIEPEIAALLGRRPKPRPTHVNKHSAHQRLSYSPFHRRGRCVCARGGLRFPSQSQQGADH